MEEALANYKREKSAYDPEPLKRLKKTKMEVLKYNQKVYFVKYKNVILKIGNEKRYFSSIVTAKRVLGLEESPDLHFFSVWLNILDERGNVNEENIKRMKNLVL